MSESRKLARILPADAASRNKASARIERLIMPHRALGRLLELGEKVAGITGWENMDLGRKAVAVMAGDHGVAEEGVSAYPQEVTGQMVRGFCAGGAGINVLGRHAGIEVMVVDMGVKSDLSDLVAAGKVVDARVRPGTDNIRRGPAMSRVEAIRCLEAGISVAHRLADSGVRMIGTGDMGIANTTPSTAIASAVTGLAPSRLAGRGTGVDEAGLARKIKVLEDALAVNRPDPRDGLDLLSKIGGFEIGGLAGLVLGAAERRIPVTVDGVISAAAALIAFLLEPLTADYMFAAHRSVEPAQAEMFRLMGLEPILDLGMRLGEGTGCALAMPIIEAGARVVREMASFDEAGVSGKA